ncbi:MAG: thioredoxin domain-containing protein [Pyrinomonadaceae bacterium]
MKNEPKKSSNVPYIIIGVVLIAVLGVVALGTGLIGAGWWISNKTQQAANSANRPANSTAAAKTPAAPVNAPPGAQPPNLLGSPTASVTVEEFADFQCGSCAVAHPTMKEIQQVYGSRIKFIFRNYPLAIPAHDKAYDAAVAAEAAGMQDRNKFWAMQDQLFTNQAAWTANPNYRSLWMEYAGKIGLDTAKIQSDMAGIAAKTRVDQDLARGKALGVNSTPSLYINSQIVPFPDMNIQSLRRIIDAELQRAAAAPATIGTNTK